MFLFVDFESYFDSSDYTLKKLSMIEYVRDSRYQTFGVGIAIDDEPVTWWTNDSWTKAYPWDEATVVSHQAKFDGLILKEKYGIVPAQYICTKALSKATLGKTVKGHSLREIAEHFGFEPKGQMKTDGKLTLTPEELQELGEYCKHDVVLCREILRKLRTEFPENQYPVMDWTIRTFVNPKLVLNTELLEKASEEERERRANIFEKVGIPKSVFSSNQQFEALLRDRGLEVPYKTSARTGKRIPALALGDPAFLEMAENEDNKELFDFCQARIAAKSTLLETRSAKLARIGKTGPWPFDVEFSGATQTHRFSGGSGAGGNPQNFTRGSVLREAVMAPAGYKLVVGDFSNIELRLVAYLSKDPGLIQALEQNRDLYCDFASAFYGKTITKEDKVERQFGKTAILGLGYGMGPAKFAKTVRLQTGQELSQEDAERAVNLYRAKYNKVPALWDRLHESIKYMTKEFGLYSDQYPYRFGIERITLPSWLHVRFPNLRREGKEWVYDVWKKKTEKESVKLYGGKVVENICQALAGELCKQALLEVKDWAVGQCHDELILCVPNGLAQMAATRLKVAMTRPPSWLPEMRLKADVHIGQTWAEAK